MRTSGNFFILSRANRTRRTLALALGLAAIFTLLSLGLNTANPAYAATTFTVNSTGDAGDQTPGDGRCFTGQVLVIGDECTLRAAIEEANAFAGRDTVEFDVPTTGVATIAPGSQLPTVAKPLVIDGYSQDGSAVNTAATGTNAVLKIELDGSNAGSSASGLVVTARNSTVRGLVINDFSRFGVLFDTVTLSDAGRTLEGCFIGTNASGTSGTENEGNGGGVVIDDGEGNVVGGNTPAARNLISGNNDTGIFISSPANGNKVQGNLIGTDKNGANGNLSNRTGIHIVGGSDNTIGGGGAAGNTIAYNRGHGIQVQDVSEPGSGTGNRILSNSIHSNNSLGIQLGADGATPNDYGPPPDTDAGANRLQNFPDITSAQTFGNVTSISGTLFSVPSTRDRERVFIVQFFSNPSTNPDEGRTFLGQIKVTTNRKGKASIGFSPAQRVPVGEFITATATRKETGDTSEFSGARRVEPPVVEG